MKVVVTGATSMIGVAFVEACIETKNEVLAIVRRNSRHLDRLPESGLVKYVYSSLEDLESVAEVDGEYDALFHFAWDYTTREGRYNVEGQEKNIEYTLKAVKLAQKLSCKKFIGAGSQAEYGKVDGIIDDKTPFNPQIPYGMAKLAAYWLSKALCEQNNMKHYWGRIFSIYGKYDHEGTLLPYAIDALRKGEKAYFSSGRQTWNYLHAKDAGRMFLEICLQDAEPGTYFIAHDHSAPLKSYLNEVIAMFGTDAEYEFEDDCSTSLNGIHPDMSSTFQRLSFQPKISFTEGIREMIEYRSMKKE